MKGCDENCFECRFEDCILDARKPCKTDVDRSFIEGEHRLKKEELCIIGVGTKKDGLTSWHH